MSSKIKDESFTLDPSEGVAIFTDGSSDNNGDRSGGWAWIALDAFEGMQADSGYCADTTNNQMEIRGVSEGLTFLYTLYGPCDVLVYSDSEYVILGVNENRRRNRNKAYWKTLDDSIGLHTAGHKAIVFEHVRGHSDDVYNHMVDDLAGRARRRLGQNDEQG